MALARGALPREAPAARARLRVARLAPPIPPSPLACGAPPASPPLCGRSGHGEDPRARHSCCRGSCRCPAAAAAADIPPFSPIHHTPNASPAAAEVGGGVVWWRRLCPPATHRRCCCCPPIVAWTHRPAGVLPPPPPHRPSAGREPGGVEGMAGTTLPRLPAFFSARASLRVRGGAGAGGMWMAWV